MSEDAKNTATVVQDGRPSLAELKNKRGRKTNEQIIAEYEASKKAGGGAPAAPGALPAPGPASVFLLPRHVKGISNVPFAATAALLKDRRWNLDENDQEFLSGPLADFLNEIMPELAKKYPKGAILAICFASVAAKKTAEIAQAERLKETPITRQPIKEPAPEAKPAHQAAGDSPEVGADGLTAAERALRVRSSGQ